MQKSHHSMLVILNVGYEADWKLDLFSLCQRKIAIVYINVNVNAICKQIFARSQYTIYKSFDSNGFVNSISFADNNCIKLNVFANFE